MSDDRITRLSERFRKHGAGRPPESERVRERKTFYLDGGLVNRLDTVYRELNHELYPNSISKSAFLEAIIEKGLAYLPEIKSAFLPTKEHGQSSDTP